MSVRSKSIACTLLFCLLVTVVLGCGSSKNEDSDSPPASISGGTPKPVDKVSLVPGAEPVVVNTEALRKLTSRPEAPSQQDDPHPIVVMTTNFGDIKIKLNRVKAPVTVENFLNNYVEREFYDQTIFQYVDKGKMIAGGGYTADYQLKPPREDIRNEATNGLKNKAGTICMARYIDTTHSSNSQFIINLTDNPELDHKSTSTPQEYGFCVFGEVIEGMDVLQAISEVEVVDKEDFPKTPVEPVIVESVRRQLAIEAAENGDNRIE